MAKKAKTTFQKMEKEKARREKRMEKEARRTETKALKAASEPKSGGEDPDIAGIRPGPQPLPDQWKYGGRG